MSERTKGAIVISGKAMKTRRIGRGTGVVGLMVMLAACGGLSEEERQAAIGGALVPDAGAADRGAALSADADERRREMAEAAEAARVERARVEQERRQEALRLAAEQRARAEFPEGVDALVTMGEDGPVLVRGNTREDERWAEAEDRRARAMRERADRYERRYEREARARERREDRLRERGYFEERYADERAMGRREAEAQMREMRRRDRDARRADERGDDLDYEDGSWR